MIVYEMLNYINVSLERSYHKPHFFQNGIQGVGHPQPGKPFFAIGFPRTAFLPDTEKGRRVLRLLEAAFNQRLTFTISSGGTPGSADVVVWNDSIAHKTEFGTAKDGRGYPDSNYLDNVIAQLSQFGLTDEHTV
jgi:deltex-like protein